MKIRKGDVVKMLVGKDRGKNGKVIKVDLSANKVVVEGLNLLKKNKRPRRQGEKGEIISIPRAVSVSNVGFVCPNCKKSSRLGFVPEKTGEKKVRLCKKCQTRI